MIFFVIAFSYQGSMADSLDPPLEPLRRTTSENLQAASERLLLPVRIPKRRTSSRKNSLVRRSPRESNSPINIPNRLLDTNDGILSPRRQIMCVGNYDLGRTIGSGQFGKVKIATHVITGETVSFLISYYLHCILLFFFKKKRLL